MMMLSREEHRQLVSQDSESNIQEMDSNNTATAGCRSRCPKVLVFFVALYVAILVAFLSCAVLLRKRSVRPHVIVVLADDLGWNDVEWHDPDMRTPTLQGLLETGVFLNSSYAHPLDSPSRAAFFTGMYPFRMGLQHEMMVARTPTFVPSNWTMLPVHLKKMGYKTYLAGKWHLGFCDWKYTPTSRGFDSFCGFYTDQLDYYTHRDSEGNYDFRSGEMVDFHSEGTHSTSVITQYAYDIINNHDVTVPLFLVVSYQAVHSPAQVPERYLNETCVHISDPARRSLCALTAMMDEGVGNLTAILHDKDMLHNAVVIVTSDNGGVTSKGSSNHPFRGSKGELYEGGTRVPALLSSESLLSEQGYTYNGLFHQVDWFSTILSLIGSPEFPSELDSLNHWHALRTNSPSPRTEVVYNIDDHYNHAAIRVDDFKLIQGQANFSQHSANASSAPQLYDLGSDPGESTNLAQDMPQRLEYMQALLAERRKQLLPAQDKPADPKSNPAIWKKVWTPGWC